MAQPGWFPDPGGQAGMFRYWDGSAWSLIAWARQEHLDQTLDELPNA